MSIYNEKLKCTIPMHEIESSALDQIKKALDITCLKALAIMPDVHAGYDLPIGAVALLDDHIWPGGVGFDISCGVGHINTKLKIEDIPSLQEVSDFIEKNIPVGFSQHKQPQEYHTPFISPNKKLMHDVNAKASLQSGTLGGGNHFIEIGVNSKNEIGITVHSGSRKCGHLIASYYMKQSEGPIPINSELGQEYYNAMLWAESYAYTNRYKMLLVCMEALSIPVIKRNTYIPINETHNHAIITNDGILHRKGATPANKGELGVIPANMRDGVYITRGLGDTTFLSSASHGAGRTMSRKKAKTQLSSQVLDDYMQGIICGDLTNKLDESPDAYKNIDTVLGYQDGSLVEVIDHFKPLINIKG